MGPPREAKILPKPKENQCCVLSRLFAFGAVLGHLGRPNDPRNASSRSVGRGKAKGKKGVGTGNALDHLRPKGLVGLVHRQRRCLSSDSPPLLLHLLLLRIFLTHCPSSLPPISSATISISPLPTRGRGSNRSRWPWLLLHISIVTPPLPCTARVRPVYGPCTARVRPVYARNPSRTA